MSPSAIRHRIATGRLHEVWRGAYAVGRPQLTPTGVWTAALLTCGPGAVLINESAAELWTILRAQGQPLEVCVPARARRRFRDGLIVHRRTLDATDVTEHEGLRVTTPTCTLVDIANRVSPTRLESAIAEADRLDLTDPETLRGQLSRFRGRPGVAQLRRVLNGRSFVLTDSELERRFLPLARAAGLPTPRTQEQVNGFRVDFFWPQLGLVVETDGLRYHRTPAQQARDRLRDQAHTAAGLTCLRFSYAQVSFDPDHVRATLVAVASRCRRAG